MSAATPHQDTKINVLAEFERLGIAYEWSTDAEHVKCRCPFHDDEKPSAQVNIKKGAFKCFAAGCEENGDIVSLLARYLKTTRATVIADLSKRYDFEKVKTIPMATVERYHQAIWAAKPLLAELYARGITDKIIRERRLGEKDGRITIPIPNEGKLWVNVRKYLPGAPGPEKMQNTKGHSSVRLYPYDQLEYDDIVLTGGEMKALVGALQLNEHKIGCITATSGEGNWDTRLTAEFRGKRVWVIMDIDQAGRSAAETVAGYLYHVAAEIFVVHLPLDADAFPSGDINDFHMQGGKLKPLLDAAEPWQPNVAGALEETEPEDSDLVRATNANMAGKRVRLRATIAAMDTAPYVIPKTIQVRCDRAQKECTFCRVFLSAKDESKQVFELNNESPAILDMVGSNRNAQHSALCLGLGVPESCRVVNYEPIDFYNVEDTRISPQLEITNRANERVMQPAVCIGGGVELNESYELIGRMHPHPKTQQSTLIISKYKATQDALSSYVLEEPERLEMFRPHDWTVEAIEERLGNLYADIESNVTRIYQRRDLHLMVDLTYHSPLLLPFDGKTHKGWVETLIVGDTAQGKSDTILGMMKHYGLGTKVECKNASVAGLLGGLQQSGTRWFVTWGMIPTHDKRLVFLEELKGAHVDVIGKLTDMRSSGVAEIPKIEKQRTHARVRLIAASNARSDRDLATYNFGIEAIKELVGANEDVRRFDAALVLDKRDIDEYVLNQLQESRPNVDSVHTSELTRALILWAWTRSEEQVQFTPDATKRALHEATRLCSMFTDVIPLVDRGSMRLKIARLAASLACRTFSTSADMQTVIVLDSHVAFIGRYLERIYSATSFGYLEFTDAQRITSELVDPPAIQKVVNQLPFPKDFCKQMLRAPCVDIADLQDYCGWERDKAMELMSFLVRKHALRRTGRNYHKTPPFIALLKKMLDEDKFEERPDHIPELYRSEF